MLVCRKCQILLCWTDWCALDKRLYRFKNFRLWINIARSRVILIIIQLGNGSYTNNCSNNNNNSKQISSSSINNNNNSSSSKNDKSNNNNKKEILSRSINLVVKIINILPKLVNEKKRKQKGKKEQFSS